MPAIDIDRLQQRVFGEWTKNGRTIIYLVARHKDEFRSRQFAGLGQPNRSLHIDAVRLFGMLLTIPGVAESRAMEDHIGAVLFDVCSDSFFAADI